MILVERSLINGSKEKEGSLLKSWFSLFKENVIFLLVSASPLLITELMLGCGITTKILENYIMLPIILGLIALFSFVPFIILELFSLVYSLKKKIEKVYKEIVPDEKR